MVTRNGNAMENVAVYKNKTSPALTTTGTGVTAALPDIALYFFCLNNNGTKEYYSTRQLSLIFLGKYITTSQRDIIVDAFETYMDANGKGVIP